MKNLVQGHNFNKKQGFKKSFHIRHPRACLRREQSPDSGKLRDARGSTMAISQFGRRDRC
jgi:hypothetical protein